MRQWTKFQQDVLLVARDWTIDLDGATIVSAPAPVVPETAQAEMTLITIDGPITKYWLRGGRPKKSFWVMLSVVTHEGETLTDRIRVTVR
jgi:hypothetical protein